MDRVLLLDGDLRLDFLYRMLCERGFLARRLFNARGENLRIAIQNSQIIICPIPFTKNGETLYSQECGSDIPQIESYLCAKQRLYGGNLPQDFLQRISERGVFATDLMTLSSVCEKNSVATAEAVIAKAILNSPINIDKSLCLVAGYGRCGTTIAKLLSVLGAQVSVYDNSTIALQKAIHSGFSVLSLNELSDKIGIFKFIFNTVPHLIFTQEILQNADSHVCIFDIASALGGVDLEYCKANSISARICPGLPGIYSPQTSAEILLDAIIYDLEGGMKNEA